MAAQFELIAHNLSECSNEEERRELLKGMVLVIDKMADLSTNEHSLLDSGPNSIARSNPPLSKAAHH